jgi:glycosyltransferase involved in cell wall biosynthesis
VPSRPTESPEHVTFSVVIPVYGNRETLPLLLERLEDLSRHLPGPMEAVFVVDGSPDDSYAVLSRLVPGARIPTQLISHSRNFGAFPAIRTGMSAARGDYVGVMAADMQEPPELMIEFFRALYEDRADVAVGRRESRDDPAVSSALSRLYWSAYRRHIIRDLPPGGVDVFAVNRHVVDQLMRLNESHSSLVGLLYWVGFRRVEIPYSRLERAEGKSGWTFRKKVRYLTDSVFSFTDLPVKVLTLIGALGTIVTTVAGLIVLVAWATGNIDATGYTPLMLVLLLSTFVILFGLGVVGSYVWRIYENSKSRPNAIVATSERFGESSR